MYLITISSQKLIEVSYLITKGIIFAGEAHTIVENLTKPCMFRVAKILLSENDYSKPKSIPLSDNRISRRIDDMDMYIKSEVYSR